MGTHENFAVGPNLEVTIGVDATVTVNRPNPTPEAPVDPERTDPATGRPEEPRGADVSRPRTPVAALVYCAVLALGLTALGLLCVAGGVAGPPSARMFALIGLVILTPAALMWTAIVRLATRPLRGAVLLLATVTTVSIVLIALGVSSVALGGTGMKESNVVAIGLVYLGGAALLAAQVFGRSRYGTASTRAGEDQ